MSQESNSNPKTSRIFLIVIGALVVVGAALLGRDLMARRSTAATPTPAVIAAAPQLLQAATPLPPTATPTPEPTVTPVVVTPSPAPANVFEAATRAVEATAQAEQFGTPTPLPTNWVVATSTPRPVLVTPTATAINSATAEHWAARETAIAFTTGTPTLPPGGIQVVTATPTRVFVPVEELPPPAPTAVFPADLTGKILFRSNMISGDTQPYAINPDGSGLVRLTADWPIGRAAAREARSADGRYRARISRDLASGQFRLYYSEGDSDELIPLTSFGGISSPAWSPAEDAIAFVSTASGNEEIWLAALDGREPVRLTTNSWEADQRPTWTPDGQQIIFMSNRTGRRQLWIMNADGSEQRPWLETDYEAWDPIWVKYAD